jgi:hypothetical protein
MLKKDKRGGALEYKKGDLLGENKHIFLKEIEPKVYIVNGKKRKHRRALFKCGLCEKEFKNYIQKIKTNYPKSCGCLQPKSVKKYFEEKRNDKN